MFITALAGILISYYCIEFYYRSVMSRHPLIAFLLLLSLGEEKLNPRALNFEQWFRTAILKFPLNLSWKQVAIEVIASKGFVHSVILIFLMTSSFETSRPPKLFLIQG